MADPLTRAGGYVPFAENEKVTSVGLTRVGRMSLQTIGALLSRIARADVSTDPVSGVFGDSDLACTMTGDLEVTVSTGWLQIFKAAADEYSPDYQWGTLDADTALALAAHDPANPRIDRIVATVTTADELAENHDVKDPVSGTISSTPEYTRRRIAVELAVVTGTPASSPSAPSTPADSVSLCTVAVPAASGAGVATDTRTVVPWSIGNIEGDVTLHNGEVRFNSPLSFERPINMRELAEAVDNGSIRAVSSVGAWSASLPGDPTGDNDLNVDGDSTTFPRSRVKLSSPAANDEINIPLDDVYLPGCGMGRVILIAEADQGTVTVDAQLGYLSHSGTSTTPTQIDISNTQVVADAQRRIVTLDLDPDVALFHGVDHASGARFYNLRLRVTAVAGTPGMFVIYGIVPLLSTTHSRSAWGYSAN